jgi:hypothetical protein
LYFGVPSANERNKSKNVIYFTDALTAGNLWLEVSVAISLSIPINLNAIKCILHSQGVPFLDPLQQFDLCTALFAVISASYNSPLASRARSLFAFDDRFLGLLGFLVCCFQQISS